jgi:hypothetical protein
MDRSDLAVLDSITQLKSPLLRLVEAEEFGGAGEGQLRGTCQHAWAISLRDPQPNEQERPEPPLCAAD